MEKRIGSILILVEEKESINDLNNIVSKHANIIIGRLGLPNENRSIISLLIEGSTDMIGSLTGQLGRLKGIKVKSVVMPIE
jgi:putative iron-only hydrogenase system regulator